MKSKVCGFIKSLIWRMLYCHRILISGIPSLNINSKIHLNKTGKIVIGEHCHFSSNSYLSAVDGGIIEVGKSVFINRNTIIVARNSIRIGNNCALGPNVIIYDHDHCFNHDGLTDGYKLQPVTIGDNCWIGAGCIILRGASIGAGCVIGAGAVVTGVIPANSKVIAKSISDLEVIPI